MTFLVALGIIGLPFPLANAAALGVIYAFERMYAATLPPAKTLPTSVFYGLCIVQILAGVATGAFCFVLVVRVLYSFLIVP